MPRKRHVSRNPIGAAVKMSSIVMPRKRHVSRNNENGTIYVEVRSCLARGM